MRATLLLWMPEHCHDCHTAWPDLSCSEGTLSLPTAPMPSIRKEKCKHIVNIVASYAQLPLFKVVLSSHPTVGADRSWLAAGASGLEGEGGRQELCAPYSCWRMACSATDTYQAITSIMHSSTVPRKAGRHQQWQLSDPPLN